MRRSTTIRRQERGVTRGRVVLLAMSCSCVLAAMGAENKMDVSGKSRAPVSLPGSLPGGEKPSPGGDGLRSRSSLSPQIDMLMPQTAPPPANANQQKALGLYLDKQKNWMFVDPKETPGKDGANEVFGVTEFSKDGKEKQGAVERYWQREAKSNTLTSTNREDAVSGYDSKEESGGTERVSGSEDPGSPAKDGTGTSDAFARPQGMDIGMGMRDGGLRLPGAMSPAVAGFGSGGFGGPDPRGRPGFGPGGTMEPIRPSSVLQDLGPRLFGGALGGGPVSGPGGVMSLQPGGRVPEANPAAGRAAPSLSDPASRSLSDSGRGLALPSGISSGAFGAIGAPGGLGGGLGSISPVPPPTAPSLAPPRQPPVLNFPSRNF